jgi:hypothetical protein
VAAPGPQPPAGSVVVVVGFGSCTAVEVVTASVVGVGVVDVLEVVGSGVAVVDVVEVDDDVLLLVDDVVVVGTPGASL